MMAVGTRNGVTVKYPKCTSHVVHASRFECARSFVSEPVDSEPTTVFGICLDDIRGGCFLVVMFL